MSAAAQARARQLFGYFESGQSAQLFAAFSPQMKKASSSAKVSTMAKEVASQLGREQKMMGENFVPDLLSRQTIYSRFAQFSKSKDPVFTVIAIDPAGLVAMFQFRPAPPPPGNRFVDYKVKTKLELPFRRRMVCVPGRHRESTRTQMRTVMPSATLSIFTVLKNGQAFSGDGTKNEQFYCYGHARRRARRRNRRDGQQHVCRQCSRPLRPNHAHRQPRADLARQPGVLFASAP